MAVAISPIALRSTSTSVSCSPNPLPYYAITTCTASVTDTDAGTPVTPTGPVRFDAEFSEGAFSARTCTLAGSGASASCSADIPAPHRDVGNAIEARYNGDAVHSVSSSSPTVVQGEADPTKTTLGCAQATLAVGQSTTCTATVTNKVGAQFIEKGHVAFSGTGDDQFTPASCKLSGGPTATCETTYTPTGGVGPHTITAQTTFYPGFYDLPSSGSLQINVQPSP